MKNILDKLKKLKSTGSAKVETAGGSGKRRFIADHVVNVNKLKKHRSTGSTEVETRRGGWQRRFLTDYALLIILALLWLVFSILMPDKFFSFGNLLVIISAQVVLLILSLAMLLPLILGEFDISAAANLGLAQIIVTGFCSKMGLPTPAAILVALGISSGIGVINGTLVSRVGINSIICTLGMASIISGIVYGYTGGTLIIDNIPRDLVFLGRGELGGVRLPVFYMIAIFIFMWYFLEHTPVGRYLYAVGGAKEAARLAGINVRRITLLAFVISGLLAGFAGIILAGQLGVGSPAQGPSYLFPALTSAFLGAAAIKAGTPNVRGLFVAALTLATGTTGLQLMGVPFWVESLFNGAALILAMSVIRYLRREAI
jgi:ribose transport system permease protein